MSAAPASERAANFQDTAYHRPAILPALGPALVSPLPTPAAVPDRTARAAAMSPVAELPSLVDRVHDIIALDSQPVLRNLLITQCYHDLSAESVKLLGGRNAHWCTFATWASKTAGRFIRNELVPAMLRGFLVSEEGGRETLPPPRVSGVELRASAHDEPQQGSAPRSSFDFLAPLWSDALGIIDLPERILLEVSSEITQGNLKVFSELGPLFARFIQLYRGCSRPDDALLETLVEGLLPGPTQKGGQELLRSAMAHYHRAMLTDDPDVRAELILLGNTRVGLHEQVRLQPYIERSLNAPVRCMVDVLRSTGRRFPKLVRTAMANKTRGLQELWRLLATKEMMTMRLPDEVLELGADLPAPPGAPLHSPELVTIEDRELYELLREYNAHDHTTAGSGAGDWALLPQRMSYICELFRSRQSSSRLLERPFTREQHAAIVAWRKPTRGDL